MTNPYEPPGTESETSRPSLSNQNPWFWPRVCLYVHLGATLLSATGEGGIGWIPADARRFVVVAMILSMWFGPVVMLILLLWVERRDRYLGLFMFALSIGLSIVQFVAMLPMIQ